MKNEYKICNELQGATPEILRNFEKGISGNIYLVKRQVMMRCPLTNELVPEHQCQQCKHHFGQPSNKWIYCLPKTEKVKGKR